MEAVAITVSRMTNSHGGLLLGIDLGGSGCKVTILTGEGVLLCETRGSYPTSRPNPGWVEQDPDHWVTAAAGACREALAYAGSSRVRAVSVSSATHTAVLLDGSDRPVRPAIMLSDLRAAPQAERLDRDSGDLVVGVARNRVTAGWTLPQLCWVLQNEPEVWAEVRCVVFAKDYLRAHLAGDTVTDWIDAEGSLLLDAAARLWSADLCSLVPLDPAMLPRVGSPLEVVGEVTESAAMLFGIAAGTPVVAGCSDTAAEALACGANRPGAGVVKIATAGNVNVVAAGPRPSRSYFTYSHPLEGLWYHSYGTSAAAASRDWLEGILGRGTPDGDVEAEIVAVPPGAGGLLFHPYLYGERAPVFDPTLRASFVGLAADHGPSHLVRAVLEGVAFSLAECVVEARAAGLAPDDLRLVGGGARSAVWAQIVADAIGVELTSPVLTDASAGAALLAGLGVGTLEAGDVIVITDRSRRQIAPDPARHRLYARLLDVYREARDRIAPVTRALASAAEATSGTL
jgi:xylulokinase